MNTGRCRATRCAWATSTRRRWADSSRARPPTSTRGNTCGSRPTACWRSGSAASRAGATIPSYLYSGGNSELRGYQYLEFIGNKAFFADAELRFPLIEAALTPLGVIGGLRAVAFANFGASQFAQNKMQISSRAPITRAEDPGLHPGSVYRGDHADPRPPRTITGLRLVDGRASYGLGLETFALGFPIHFDWSWRTLLNKSWEDYVYSYEARFDGETSGSRWFRKPKFSIWIGYDF